MWMELETERDSKGQTISHSGTLKHFYVVTPKPRPFDPFQQANTVEVAHLISFSRWLRESNCRNIQTFRIVNKVCFKKENRNLKISLETDLQMRPYL